MYDIRIEPLRNHEPTRRQGGLAPERRDSAAGDDKMLFTEGTEVKGGDPLFELDKKPYVEQLAAAKGMLSESLLIGKGLTAGERNVVEGLQEGREGVLVQPITAAQMAEASRQAEASPAKDGETMDGKE